MAIKPFRTRSLSSIFLAASAVAFVMVFSGTGSPARPVKAAEKPDEAAKWDRQAAARYLDSREIYWQGWDRAQKDHGTLCVSCHTQATYGLARPALRSPLGETGPAPAEQVMLASIEKRVKMWKDMAPFYNDATSGAGKEGE